MSKPVPEPIPKRQLTILHIEDNEANRYVVRRVLSNAGFAVAEATTGAAGLQAAATQQPDLIILDVQLPDLSGFEVCHRIKSDPALASIPVLHLSASFVNSQSKAQGLDSGADAYLAQPVEPIELIATVRSLLRIRRAEESALVLAREWQTTFDAISDGVGLLDPTGKFLRCNQALMRLFDKPLSDILGCPHQDMMQRVLKIGSGSGNCFRRAKETQRRERQEFQAGDRWFLKTIDPVLDQLGTFTGAVYILSDITESKQAEQQRQQAKAILQERNQRLDLLYETTRALLSSEQPLTLINSLFQKLKDPLELDVYFNYLVDTDRNQLRLTGHWGISVAMAQEIEWLDYGQAVCGVVAQQRCQIVRDNVQQSLEPNTELIRSLGITAYACQPLIAQGYLFGTLSFGSRRRAQFTAAETDLLQALCDQMAIALDRAQLLASLQQQTEKMRQANQIKDEFLAVLSHELRSPLNPILGWTQLLRTRTFDAPATQRALETIERNAKLQTQLIEDLLDISRILQGKMRLNIAPVDLGTAIESAIETVRLAAEAKHIQLNFAVNAAAPPHQSTEPPIEILGDAARLQQIVWNLLSNAVKFTPQQGTIDIHLESHNSTAQIQVKDNGKGINPDFLPYAFEYFRQEDSKTTRRFGGLGLGLAIVRYLTELHGGTVQAESLGEGEGATFTVQLPLLKHEGGRMRDEATALHLSSLATQPFLTDLRILVVDDEADMRELMITILEQAGAVVRVTASAAEALVAYDQFKPDILISDIGMPDIDGYTLMQRVRNRYKAGEQIPAIALTAYARAEDEARALAEGFHLHLTKPIEPDKLMTAVAGLMKKWQRAEN